MQTSRQEFGGAGWLFRGQEDGKEKLSLKRQKEVISKLCSTKHMV